jgi:hypothetical protein
VGILPSPLPLTAMSQRKRTPGLSVVAKLKEQEKHSKVVKRTDSIEDEIEFLRRTVFAGDESFVDREEMDSDGGAGDVGASSDRDLGAERSRGGTQRRGDGGSRVDHGGRMGEGEVDGGGEVEEEEEDWALAGLLNSMLRGTAVECDVKHEPVAQVEDADGKPAKESGRRKSFFETVEEKEERERRMRREAEVGTPLLPNMIILPSVSHISITPAPLPTIHEKKKVGWISTEALHE